MMRGILRRARRSANAEKEEKKKDARLQAPPPENAQPPGSPVGETLDERLAQLHASHRDFERMVDQKSRKSGAGLREQRVAMRRRSFIRQRVPSLAQFDDVVAASGEDLVALAEVATPSENTAGEDRNRVVRRRRRHSVATSKDMTHLFCLHDFVDGSFNIAQSSQPTSHADSAVAPIVSDDVLGMMRKVAAADPDALAAMGGEQSDCFLTRLRGKRELRLVSGKLKLDTVVTDAVLHAVKSVQAAQEQYAQALSMAAQSLAERVDCALTAFASVPDAEALGSLPGLSVGIDAATPAKHRICLSIGSSVSDLNNTADSVNLTLNSVNTPESITTSTRPSDTATAGDIEWTRSVTLVKELGRALTQSSRNMEASAHALRRSIEASQTPQREKLADTATGSVQVAFQSVVDLADVRYDVRAMRDRLDVLLPRVMRRLDYIGVDADVMSPISPTSANASNTPDDELFSDTTPVPTSPTPVPRNLSLAAVHTLSPMPKGRLGDKHWMLEWMRPLAEARTSLRQLKEDARRAKALHDRKLTSIRQAMQRSQLLSHVCITETQSLATAAVKCLDVALPSLPPQPPSLPVDGLSLPTETLRELHDFARRCGGDELPVGTEDEAPDEEVQALAGVSLSDAALQRAEVKFMRRLKFADQVHVWRNLPKTDEETLPPMPRATIDDVLHIPALKSALRMFLDRMLCGENLRFVEAVDELRHKSEMQYSEDTDEVLSKAAYKVCKLYRRFCDVHADECVNLPARLFERISSAVCNGDSDKLQKELRRHRAAKQGHVAQSLCHNVFASARQEIIDLMRVDSLPKFNACDELRAVLSDPQITIK